MTIDPTSFEYVHPFGHFIPEGSQTLIVGTFPPPEHRWAFPFFYPNKLNLMWNILSRLAGIPLEDPHTDPVELRRQILIRLQAGMTDMGSVIQRKINNAYDENLILIKSMDILRLLDQHPTLSKIILTSSSGKVSVMRWFVQHLRANGIEIKIPVGIKPLVCSFDYQSKSYEVHILYSTSRRAANRISTDKLVEMYGSVLQPNTNG